MVTFIVVVLRYVFDSGSIALQETTTYFHATIFLVGMAYTLQHNAHVRVDIFYSRLSKQGQAWVDLCGALFLLLPFMLFISWISWEYIADSWAVMEGSREAGGLPGVFLLKSLILVMTSLLSLQALTQVARNIETILNQQGSD
jgi:TRAP-type mannitol/chloroaromatic compound transport system permease small subunit